MIFETNFRFLVPTAGDMMCVNDVRGLPARVFVDGVLALDENTGNYFIFTLSSYLLDDLLILPWN